MSDGIDIWPRATADSRARLHARILEEVRQWPTELRLEWAELAAVLQHDQGNPRVRAEQLVYWRMRKDGKA